MKAGSSVCVRQACCRASLSAEAGFAGSDLWVVVVGGDMPHIGSISVGIPRSSLADDGTASATVSTFNITGHKDDAVGNMFAARLAARFSCVASVSCGIHFDRATAEDLAEILDKSHVLLEKLEAELQARSWFPD